MLSYHEIKALYASSLFWSDMVNQTEPPHTNLAPPLGGGGEWIKAVANIRNRKGRGKEWEGKKIEGSLMHSQTDIPTLLPNKAFSALRSRSHRGRAGDHYRQST